MNLDSSPQQLKNIKKITRTTRINHLKRRIHLKNMRHISLFITNVTNCNNAKKVVYTVGLMRLNQASMHKMLLLFSTNGIELEVNTTHKYL